MQTFTSASLRRATTSSYLAFPLPLAGETYGCILAYNRSRRVGPRNDLQINCRRNIIQWVIFAGSAADIQVVKIRCQWQRIYCDIDRVTPRMRYARPESIFEIGFVRQQPP